MGFFDEMNGPPPIVPGAPTFAQISSTPGMQAPASQLTPSAAPVVSSPVRMSFWDRLKRAGQNISGNINPNPQALVDSGLISQADLQHARSRGLLDFGLGVLGQPAMGTFGQALAGGVNNMRQGFNEAIQQPIQQMGEAQNVGYQQSILRNRAAIGSMFMPQRGDTPQQTTQKLMQAYQAYVAAGDMEMAGKIGETLKGSFDNASKPMEVEYKDTGNQLVPINKLTGQPIPWLQPMPKQMSDDAKSYRDAQQALATTNAASNREDRLVQQYNGEIKPYVDQSRQIQSAYAAIPGATKHDITAEPELLYNGLTLAHPGMQVPRNELQSYQGSVGPVGNVSRLFEKLQNGKGGALLTDDQVKGLINVVRSAHQNTLNDVAPIRADYAKRAARWQVDPQVFDDPTEMLPALSSGGSQQVRDLLKTK